MNVSEVKIIFSYPWSIDLFVEIIKKTNLEPLIVFNWMYKNILGNCIKKDLDFQTVISSFGQQGLVEFLLLFNEVSIANLKEIMMRKVDGDSHSARYIAETLGFIGGAISEKEL